MPLIVCASATKKFYLVRARSLIRSLREHKFLVGTRERILVRLRPRDSRWSSGPFLLLPFVTVRPSCTACSLPFSFSLSFSPILTDNVVAMVAMGIPSLAFVRHRATACPIFALFCVRPLWPSCYSSVASSSCPSSFSFFFATLFLFHEPFGTLSQGVETLFIRQRARFLSDLRGNVIITYPRARACVLHRSG